MKPTQLSVTSKDGTTIAYEQSGSGPTIILISPTLGDRLSSTKLAALLAAKFTVINYDRRGRGLSGDNPSYTISREVEDIAALVDAGGGTAYLFGQSSGAILALDAATALGTKIISLIMFEPPFIVDASRAPIPNEIGAQAGVLVAAGKPNDAIKLFFTTTMGLPGFAVTIMRFVMPTWKNMVVAAHTLPYDFAITKGTQDGKPLPADRWVGLQAPVMVIVGEKSELFFHTGAQALAKLLPNTTYNAMAGVAHGSPTLAPKRVAQAISDL